MIDWRLKEHRWEGFLRWLKWRFTYADIDHFVCSRHYLSSDRSVLGRPANLEERIAYAFFFGMTYQTSMAWVLFNRFPHIESVDLEKAQEWNLRTLANQKYNKDTKYNKGRVVQQIESIQEVVRQSQYDSLADLVLSWSSFEEAYDFIVDNFYKYGRMTAWLTCQLLQEVAEIPNLNAESMLSYDNSSWSVRSGIYFLFGDDERALSSKNSVTPEEKESLLSMEKDILARSEEYLGDSFPELSMYTLETHLCQFKKLLIGGDFPGHNATDKVERTQILQNLWPEYDFTPFFEQTMKCFHPNAQRPRSEVKPYEKLCQKTGLLINMRDLFPDLPNTYELLGVTKEETDPKVITKAIDHYAEKTGRINGVLKKK